MIVKNARSKTPQDGPILKTGESAPAQRPLAPTLRANIIDRGNIAIVELNGRLTNDNRQIISTCLKNLESVCANVIVIDLNGVEIMDEFGCGTLAVMNGWIELKGKESFLSCEDGDIKNKISALGLSRVIQEYPGQLTSVSP